MWTRACKLSMISSTSWLILQTNFWGSISLNHLNKRKIVNPQLNHNSTYHNLSWARHHQQKLNVGNIFSCYLPDCPQTLMEDDLWWKATFDGRRPLREDNLWGKTTFDWRRPLMEDGLWGKMTFEGLQPLMEDYLWGKTNFEGRHPLMKDYLWWKATFDGRWPLMEEDL